MLTFILLIFISLIFAYFSQYNAMLVNLNFGGLFITNIPLFYVVVGSFLLGLMFSYVVYTINSIFYLFNINHQNNQLKKSNLEVQTLTNKVNALESKPDNLTQHTI